MITVGVDCGPAHAVVLASACAEVSAGAVGVPLLGLAMAAVLATHLIRSHEWQLCLLHGDVGRGKWSYAAALGWDHCCAACWACGSLSTTTLVRVEHLPPQLRACKLVPGRSSLSMRVQCERHVYRMNCKCGGLNLA